MGPVSNLPVLYRNILHGIDDGDAGDLFLRLVQPLGILAAERAAYEWRRHRAFLDFALPKAAALYPLHREGVAEEVRDFIRTRFYHAAKSGAIQC